MVLAGRYPFVVFFIFFVSSATNKSTRAEFLFPFEVIGSCVAILPSLQPITFQVNRFSQIFRCHWTFFSGDVSRKGVTLHLHLNKDLDYFNP